MCQVGCVDKYSATIQVVFIEGGENGGGGGGGEVHLRLCQVG